MLVDEDEQAFLARRMVEERRRTTETSCIVRSVHEELAELYEERRRAAEAETLAIETLLTRVT